MTRFIYLSDTHWGVDAPGYTMQASQPTMLPQLLDALGEWIGEHGPVDFVLHGGDMVDSTSAENIERAAEHFQLPVPVYLCLGNHDLTRADAVDMWLDLAPQFFIDSPNFTLETPDVLLHVVPNQWGSAPYFWNGVQLPHFLPEQEVFLSTALKRRPDKVHVLSTHSPFCGVPIDQTGFDGPFHQPPLDFVERGRGLLHAHSHLHALLGAHSHINTCIAQGNGHFVTTSSFVEVPYDFKCVEIADGRLSMTTHSLDRSVDFCASYDYEKTFVQGRACDRAFGA